MPSVDADYYFQAVDYQHLNGLLEGDAYPMPQVDELINQVGKAKFISALDLTRGYWQVPVAKDGRPKTVFVTPFGLFQFNVMLFGLQGASATFQRLMDKVLQYTWYGIICSSLLG